MWSGMNGSCSSCSSSHARFRLESEDLRKEDQRLKDSLHELHVCYISGLKRSRCHFSGSVGKIGATTTHFSPNLKDWLLAKVFISMKRVSIFNMCISSERLRVCSCVCRYVLLYVLGHAPIYVIWRNLL